MLAIILAAAWLPGTLGAAAGTDSDTAVAGPKSFSMRKLLQFTNGPTSWQRQSNTVRAQAATSQSIEEAVNNGGGTANTMRAGRTGSATAWAAGQRNDIFNVVDFAASPTSGRFGK